MKSGAPRDLIFWIITVAGTAQFVGGLLWAVWIVSVFRRDRRRDREGLCIQCGFDLRHSSERCPECGAPIL